MSNWLEKFLFTSLMVLGSLVMIGLVGMLGYIVYDSLTAETFSLRKDSWACKAAHWETSMVVSQAGKVAVPITSHYQVCDRWDRKGLVE